MSRAGLIVIDVQNDYFPGGAFPLWNAPATLAVTLEAINAAQARGLPVIHVQHVADPELGRAPFFNAATPGVEIHAEVLAAAPAAPVIVKRYADAFDATDLEATLRGLEVDELLLCGMMTQNCVVFTAMSELTGGRDIAVVGDLCAAPSQVVHLVALAALGSKRKMADAASLWP